MNASPGISLTNSCRGVGFLSLLLDNCRVAKFRFLLSNCCTGVRFWFLLPNSCRGVGFWFPSRAFRPSLLERIASAVVLDKMVWILIHYFNSTRVQLDSSVIMARFTYWKVAGCGVLQAVLHLSTPKQFKTDIDQLIGDMQQFTRMVRVTYRQPACCVAWPVRQACLITIKQA